MAISRRTYYKYRDKEDPDYYEYLLIKDIFGESKGTYGYRRVSEGLKIKHGAIFNHKKAARIMKKYNLKPECVKRIRTNMAWKRIEENVQPNLVKDSSKPKVSIRYGAQISLILYGAINEHICQRFSIYMIVM